MEGVSGPFLEDDGSRIYVTFFSAYRSLPISPSLGNPDDTESWIVVDHRNFWFTWVPLRLLQTVESSKDQVRKMFSFMSDCPVTSRIANLEHGVADVLATFLHSHAYNVVNQNDRPVVIRVKLVIIRDTRGLPNTSTDLTVYDFLDDDQYALGPATKEFMESKLLRFEIEVDEGGDHYGPCSICLEDFQVKCGELLSKMPCGHVFHDVCITKWLKTSGSCPLCKFQAECETSNNVRNNPFQNENLYHRFEAEGKAFVIRN